MNEMNEFCSRKALALVAIMSIVALMATTSSADTAPAATSLAMTSTVYTMCPGQDDADVGVCTVSSGGDEIVLNAAGFKSLTFYSNESTAATYTCDVYSSSIGFDAAPTGGFKVNVTSLSESQKIITLSGPFLSVWVKCPAINAAGLAIVKVQGIKDI